MSRADGRGPDELRPIEIEPDFIPSASGSALFRDRPDAADLHRDGRGVGAAVDARARHGLGDVGVRDAARVDLGAEVARREPRPGRRPHRRDPAPGGPVAALGGRLQGARRAHRVDRLRRDPGRRRHALRGHLRRLRRAAHGAASAWSPAAAAAGAPARLGGGGLGRHRRLRAAARPAVRRGQPRRGGHERRHDRQRRADRGAGDGRANAVRAGVARSPARARRGRHRDHRPRAGPGARQV